MTASWMKLAFAVGVATGFAALIPSCADNNQTIFIRQVQAVQAPECTVTSDATALVWPSGFVDVGIASNFIVNPLVGNQLLAKGEARQNKSEPNRVQLEGAEVELVEPTGATISIGGLPNPYSVIVTGTIDPTTSADASYGVTTVEVIPPVFMEAYRKRLHDLGGIGTTQTIHAKIKIFGHTLGGTSVETGSFTYPITACYGCGISIPSDAVDAKLGSRNCKGTSASTTGTSTKTICYQGQNAVTDCRVCQGVTPLCTPCSTNTDCAGMTSPLTKVVATCNTTAGFCE